MIDRPRLLDLYCGAGGAARGYHAAGYDVVGVDIRPQPNYPYPFIQADALSYVKRHGRDYDIIHGSPVCKMYSVARRLTPNPPTHDQDIPRLRDALIGTGRPYVIENVSGAVPDLIEPVMLCGSMFGLKVYRHRYFETDPVLLVRAYHAPHQDKTPPGGWGAIPQGIHQFDVGGDNGGDPIREVCRYGLPGHRYDQYRTQRVDPPDVQSLDRSGDRQGLGLDVKRKDGR